MYSSLPLEILMTAEFVVWWMRSEEYNFCGQYAIKGVSDVDVAPFGDEVSMNQDESLLDQIEEDEEVDGPELEILKLEDSSTDSESENEYGDYFDRGLEAIKVRTVWGECQMVEWSGAFCERAKSCLWPHASGCCHAMWKCWTRYSDRNHTTWAPTMIWNVLL